MSRTTNPTPSICQRLGPPEHGETPNARAPPTADHLAAFSAGQRGGCPARAPRASAPARARLGADGARGAARRSAGSGDRAAAGANLSVRRARDPHRCAAAALDAPDRNEHPGLAVRARLRRRGRAPAWCGTVRRGVLFHDAVSSNDARAALAPTLRRALLPGLSGPVGERLPPHDRPRGAPAGRRLEIPPRAGAGAPAGGSRGARTRRGACAFPPLTRRCCGDATPRSRPSGSKCCPSRDPQRILR